MTNVSSRKLLSILAIATVLVSGSFTSAGATWSLAWWDEFNGTSLNTADWNYDIGTGCPSLCGWGNNELEYYRSENVAVSGGNLIIMSKAESFGGASFTSGKIHTKNKQTFLYGRIEMRAKIPTGGGMWPAFWMLPQADVYGGWASSGEIDIMESVNVPTTVHGTIHYGGAFPANTSTGGTYSLGGTNFADDYHVYAIEWEPDAMRWYVDGVLYSTKTSAQWFTNAAPGNPQAPFDQDFYVILNAAVGGNFPGCTSPGCITATFPQDFLVDYVRVYQDIVNAPPTVSITAPSAGATLPVGNITIDATASDSDGSVATVEFWNGFDYLGEDTTSPYSFTWNSVPNGCYDIVVRVIDNLGGVETATVDITVGLGCGQLPFLGGAFVLPTKIEAEDYDVGGEGVAYHDTDAGNNGSQYRVEDVDIEICSDTGGGFNVGWLALNEWTEYTIDVPVAGPHTFDVRVASFASGGSFRLEFNGVDKTGDVIVPVTGGWQTWTTVQTVANLGAGVQTMRFVPTTTGEFNINYFDVVSYPTAIGSDGTPTSSALHPCYPNPFNPVTTISYDLQDRETVTLAIYDVTGRRIRTLVNGESTGAGRYQQTWNGRDDAGQTVATGVYFYKLDAGAFSMTRKMVMVK